MDLKQVAKSLSIAQAGRKADVADRIKRYLQTGQDSGDIVRVRAIGVLIKKVLQFEPLPSFESLYRQFWSESQGNHRITGSQPSSQDSLPRSQTNPRRPWLFFKENPFFILKKLVTPNAGFCYKAPDTRGTCRLSFVLNEQDTALLRSNKLKLFLLCGVYDKTKPSTDALLEFPQPLEIHFNGIQVKDNVKGLKNKPGTAKPANLTPYITRPNHTNTLEMVYAFTKNDYLIFCYLIEDVQPEKILQKVLANSHISKQKTLDEFKNQDDDEDEIQEVSTRLSLKCPLSFTRLKYPTKSIACKHLPCFDALSFIYLQEQASTWTCPVCSLPVRVKDLAIDDYVMDILKNTNEDIETVEIDLDGSWKAIHEEGESTPPRKRTETPVFVKEPSIQVPLPSKKPDSPIIISLDSDDDEEEEEEIIQQQTPQTSAEQPQQNLQEQVSQPHPVNQDVNSIVSDSSSDVSASNKTHHRPPVIADLSPSNSASELPSSSGAEQRQESSKPPPMPSIQSAPVRKPPPQSPPLVQIAPAPSRQEPYQPSTDLEIQRRQQEALENAQQIFMYHSDRVARPNQVKYIQYEPPTASQEIATPVARNLNNMNHQVSHQSPVLSGTVQHQHQHQQQNQVHTVGTTNVPAHSLPPARHPLSAGASNSSISNHSQLNSTAPPSSHIQSQQSASSSPGLRSTLPQVGNKTVSAQSSPQVGNAVASQNKATENVNTASDQPAKVQSPYEAEKNELERLKRRLSMATASTGKSPTVPPAVPSHQTFDRLSTNYPLPAIQTQNFNRGPGYNPIQPLHHGRSAETNFEHQHNRQMFPLPQPSLQQLPAFGQPSLPIQPRLPERSQQQQHQSNHHNSNRRIPLEPQRRTISNPDSLFSQTIDQSNLKARLDEYQQRNGLNRANTINVPHVNSGHAGALNNIQKLKQSISNHLISSSNGNTPNQGSISKQSAESVQTPQLQQQNISSRSGEYHQELQTEKGQRQVHDEHDSPADARSGGPQHKAQDQQSKPSECINQSPAVQSEKETQQTVGSLEKEKTQIPKVNVPNWNSNTLLRSNTTNFSPSRFAPQTRDANQGDQTEKPIRAPSLSSKGSTGSILGINIDPSNLLKNSDVSSNEGAPSPVSSNQDRASNSVSPVVGDQAVPAPPRPIRPTIPNVFIPSRRPGMADKKRISQVAADQNPKRPMINRPADPVVDLTSEDPDDTPLLYRSDNPSDGASASKSTL